MTGLRPGTGAAAAICAAGVAWAMDPPPACGFEDTRFTVAPYGSGDQAAVWARPVGTGFVAYEVTFRGDRAPRYAVVQHCPTGRELLVGFPRGGGAARAVWEEMVFGPGRHTLPQIATRVVEAGGSARVMTGEIGTCVCDDVFGNEGP